MRPVYCALLILLPVCTAYPSDSLAVVLQFEDRYSELSIGEMKAEAQALVKDSGIVLSWRRMDSSLRPKRFPGWWSSSCAESATWVCRSHSCLPSLCLWPPPIFWEESPLPSARSNATGSGVLSAPMQATEICYSDGLSAACSPTNCITSSTGRARIPRRVTRANHSRRRI